MAKKDFTEVPILQNMPLTDRVVLANGTHHPSFQVIVKMLEAACEQANKHVIKLDPEDESYERILAVRQQRSRNFNDLSRWLLDSIKYHCEMAINAGTEQQAPSQQ